MSLLQKVKQTEYVRKELQAYGLDRVEIQDFDVVVTYPDPRRPDRLVVVDTEVNHILSNWTLSNETNNKRIEAALQGNIGGTQKLKTHFAEVSYMMYIGTLLHMLQRSNTKHLYSI